MYFLTKGVACILAQYESLDDVIEYAQDKFVLSASDILSLLEDEQVRTTSKVCDPYLIKDRRYHIRIMKKDSPTYKQWIQLYSML